MKRSKSSRHVFGGDWTTQKLQILSEYLKSYTTALRDKPTPHKPFRKAFIDAFAGTGYRSASRSTDADMSNQDDLFPELAAPDPKALLEGSARLALEVIPSFDRYIFIEKNAARCDQLARLRDEFPTLADSIDIRLGDANVEIQKICSKDWSSHRAVIFLDPYGMQVDWKTIEAIAETKAIDLWLLFPLGIGVNRLLTKSGKIPESWRSRLNSLLGTEDWYDEFYTVERAPDLLGGDNEHVIKASMDVIGKYFLARLRSVFSGIADEPGVLRNSSNNPLYLLCFAVGNERAKDIALRIANHLLKDLRS